MFSTPRLSLQSKVALYRWRKDKLIRVPSMPQTLTHSTSNDSRSKPVTSSLPKSAEWTLLVLLLALFLGHALWPAWRSLNTDFPNYYLAAALYRRHIPLDRIYEWIWFQRQDDVLGVREGIVGFAPNPPICALPIAPLTGFTPLAAKRVWLIVNLGLLVLALWFLRQTTTLGWRRLILFTLFCVVPLHSNFLFGQFYVVVLLLICAAYYSASRQQHFASGVLWSMAAGLKLFPAVALIYFARRKNWRALGGFLAGVVGLSAISVGTLGLEVHRVFLTQVLPQAGRGDWLDPYRLGRNSFITLWSRLFLFEPQLNPSPLVDSPALYAVFMAVTTTALIFAFLRSTEKDERQPSALEWASIIPLALLLSSTTGSYHPTVLIFTAIVGIDGLHANSNRRRAIALFLLFVVACAPIPAALSRLFPLTRLVAIVALYILLLRKTAAKLFPRVSIQLTAAACAIFILLMILNQRQLQNRSSDFSQRLSSNWAGIFAGNPVPVGRNIAFVDMQKSRYSAVVIEGNSARTIPVTGDVLAIAGSKNSNFFYADVPGRRASILRIGVDGETTTSAPMFEGHDPALSLNGQWITYLKEQNQQAEVWLSPTTEGAFPKLIVPATFYPLDAAVSSSGDVIAAVGPVSRPHLVFVRHDTGAIEAMKDIPGPVRYPAFSPDLQRLAFSRLKRGSWHLIVRDLATGVEQQLTQASCNAISPAWQDAETLLYASDCGRGVGLSSIVRVSLP